MRVQILRLVLGLGLANLSSFLYGYFVATPVVIPCSNAHYKCPDLMTSLNWLSDRAYKEFQNDPALNGTIDREADKKFRMEVCAGVIAGATSHVECGNYYYCHLVPPTARSGASTYAVSLAIIFGLATLLH